MCFFVCVRIICFLRSVVGATQSTEPALKNKSKTVMMKKMIGLGV